MQDSDAQFSLWNIDSLWNTLVLTVGEILSNKTPADQRYIFRPKLFYSEIIKTLSTNGFVVELCEYQYLTYQNFSHGFSSIFFDTPDLSKTK